MNEKLNIQDLIDMLAAKHGMNKKDADDFVRAFFQLIEESLEQDKYVKIRGLGTFKLINVGSRESINVNTGERIEIQGHTKVSFAPEPVLKNVINRPFSCFESVALNEGIVLEDTPLETDNEEKEVVESETSEIDSLIIEPSFPEEVAKGETEAEVEVEETEVNSIEAEVSSTIVEVNSTTPKVNSVEMKENNVEPELETEESEKEVASKENEIPLVPKDECTVPEESPVKQEEPVISEEEPIALEGQTVSEEAAKAKETEIPRAPAVIKAKREDAETMRYFIGIVVFVAFLCGAAIAFIYSPDLLDMVMGKTLEEELTEAEKENASDSIYDYKALAGKLAVKDSLGDIGKSMSEDTVSVMMELEAQEQIVVADLPVTMPVPSTAPEKEVIEGDGQPVVPNYDNSYEIVGTEDTYTVKEGDMLTRIALHYYGTKLLWPYIVKHNPTVIKNPNNVPYGTTIKIPKLVKKKKQ